MIDVTFPRVFLMENRHICERALQAQSTQADIDDVGRVKDPALRRILLAARLMVRTVLRETLGFDHGNRFERSFFQKPYLPGSDIHFNLSKSRKAVALVVSRAHQCGVDIEQLRPAGTMINVARSFMSEREFKEFVGLTSSHDRAWRFVETWSRKEAFLKALGVGHAFPPERIEFDRSNTHSGGHWYSNSMGVTVRTFRMLGHALSVCLSSEQIRALRFFSFHPNFPMADQAVETHLTQINPVAISLLGAPLTIPFPLQGA